MGLWTIVQRAPGLAGRQDEVYARVTVLLAGTVVLGLTALAGYVSRVRRPGMFAVSILLSAWGIAPAAQLGEGIVGGYGIVILEMLWSRLLIGALGLCLLAVSLLAKPRGVVMP